MKDKQAFNERFNSINPQTIYGILDWLEGASDEGSGRFEMMDAFKQYLIYSDDDPEKKRHLTSLFNCLDCALNEFDDAYTQPKHHEDGPTQQPQGVDATDSTPISQHTMTILR